MSQISPLWFMASLPFTAAGLFGFWLVLESALRLAKAETLRFGLSVFRMAGVVWLLTTAALVFQLFWVVASGQWQMDDVPPMLGVLLLTAPLMVGFWFLVIKSVSKTFERYAR